MSQHIVYEVNLSVDAELAQRYEQWLQQHIEQMLALPGFISATSYRMIEPIDTDKVGWTVQYVLASKASLDQYLQQHAPKMRADGVKHFGDRFTATRRIYQAA